MKYISSPFSIGTRIVILVAVVAGSAMITPQTLLAASLSAVVADDVSLGDTVIVDVFLDTEGEEINSVDGSVVFKNEEVGFEITNLSVAGSVFPMWPRSPSLRDGHIVDFIGGVPGGVNGKDLLLFSVVVKVVASKNLLVESSNAVAYLNDGEGTARVITNSVSTIPVGFSDGVSRDVWRDRVAGDNTPPETFTVQLLQDDALFNGMKFLYFETTDAQSGIAYYEVQEAGHKKVRTGTSYVLINQNDNVTATVTAYDIAGNARTVSFSEKGTSSRWIQTSFLIVAGILVYLIIRRIRRRIKNGV